MCITRFYPHILQRVINLPTPHEIEANAQRKNEIIHIHSFHTKALDNQKELIHFLNKRTPC